MQTQYVAIEMATAEVNQPRLIASQHTSRTRNLHLIMQLENRLESH